MMLCSTKIFAQGVFRTTVVAALAISANPAFAANVSALELHQIHDVGGPQKVLLSKSAIRFEHEHTGVIMFSRQPFTDVIILNPKKKLYIKMKMDRAKQNMKGLSFLLETMGEFTDQKWSAPKVVKFSGVDALVYSKTTPQKSWCKFYVLKEKSWPDQLIRLVASHSAMPDDLGIPLKMEKCVSRQDTVIPEEPGTPNQTSVSFNTTLVKQVSVPESTFSCPSDCKLTDSNRTVMGNAVGFGNYKDMLNSPDFMFQSSTKKLGGPADARLNSIPNRKNKSKLLEQMMQGPGD